MFMVYPLSETLYELVAHKDEDVRKMARDLITHLLEIKRAQHPERVYLEPEVSFPRDGKEKSLA